MVTEPFCHHQQRPVALALQQRVGRHRCSHLHRLDRGLGDRRVIAQRQHVPDSLQRRILIGFGIFRQQLVRFQRAIRCPRHDIGKSATPVHPELPATLFLRHHPIHFIRPVHSVYSVYSIQRDHRPYMALGPRSWIILLAPAYGLYLWLKLLAILLVPALCSCSWFPLLLSAIGQTNWLPRLAAPAGSVSSCFRSPAARFRAHPLFGWQPLSTPAAWRCYVVFWFSVLTTLFQTG